MTTVKRTRDYFRWCTFQNFYFEWYRQKCVVSQFLRLCCVTKCDMFRLLLLLWCMYIRSLVLGDNWCPVIPHVLFVACKPACTTDRWKTLNHLSIEMLCNTAWRRPHQHSLLQSHRPVADEGQSGLVLHAKRVWYLSADAAKKIKTMKTVTKFWNVLSAQTPWWNHEYCPLGTHTVRHVPEVWSVDKRPGNKLGYPECRKAFIVPAMELLICRRTFLLAVSCRWKNCG